MSEVRLVDREDNELGAYLAEYGAQNWKQMVIIEEHLVEWRSYGI